MWGGILESEFSSSWQGWMMELRVGVWGCFVQIRAGDRLEKALSSD